MQPRHPPSAKKHPLFAFACALAAAALFSHEIAFAAPAKNDIDDTLPLMSAAPDGLGPAALPTLTHSLLGAAHVHGSEQPDVFVHARGKPGGVWLFKWSRTSPDGVPIFAPPVQIKAPFDSRASVFQGGDGKIHALWPEEREIAHGVFDPAKSAFKRTGKIHVPGLPANVQGVCALPNPDGSYELVFELNGDTTPDRSPVSNHSSPDWRPYDAAGISTSPMRYRYLAAAHLDSLDAGKSSPQRQLSPTRREVRWGMHRIGPVNFGPGHERGIITGGRLGVFTYYRNTDPAGLSTPRGVLAAGDDGLVLRNPSITASVIAYPNYGYKTSAPAGQGAGNLIAAGEGALYFYQFTGRFTADGAPVFKQPVPALQEHAPLHAGTLPAPSVCDWDGDGVPDIVTGNSEGFVLFFKNIGTGDEPAFLPGERVRAGGRVIQIQAGYSGSVQGTPEARWGYNSPTVVDWDGDGLPDIIMGDVTGSYTVYMNRGTRTAPELEAARPLYCEGLDLHGSWRCRAAVTKLGARMALVIVDDDDQFHLYWRIDDCNVRDGGKLTLVGGSLINTSFDPAGGTGRCKLSFYDADGDGLPDLVIGTGRRSAIPSKLLGWPMPALGLRTLGTPLLMRNTGTPEKPVFEMPVPFVHKRIGVIQPGGSHERGAVLTTLGGGGPNLLTADENGYFYLYRAKNFTARKP